MPHFQGDGNLDLVSNLKMYSKIILNMKDIEKG